MHLIVFSTVLTPRIKYIFNFIFKDILKAEIEFTGNSQYFYESPQARISYGEKPLADELFFKSSTLLFSNKVEDLNIKTTSFGGYLAPFPVSDSLFPFDIFAASFFIVSRYEEYLHQKKTDEDFRAGKSLQNKWKIIDRPIIDEWAMILKNIIRTKYPDFKFHEKQFIQQPTINFNVVPSAPQGFINQGKFLLNSFFNKENKFFTTKFDQLTGLEVKTNEVLFALDKTFEKTRTSPVFFIAFPNVSENYISLNGFDKMLSRRPVGLLRPCANDKQKISDIKEGLQKLQSVLPEQVNLNSQQLEVLKFPICYLNLLSSGVSVDYSMGYYETAGFRAGTCTPFNWYDLQLEKVTPLVIKSYCFSDFALQYLSGEVIKNLIGYYINAVKVVSGSLFSSWQLRSVSDHLKYKKLSTAFKEMLADTAN